MGPPKNGGKDSVPPPPPPDKKAEVKPLDFRAVSFRR
jgi:hypothetical protein